MSEKIVSIINNTGRKKSNNNAGHKKKITQKKSSNKSRAYGMNDPYVPFRLNYKPTRGGLQFKLNIRS